MRFAMNSSFLLVLFCCFLVPVYSAVFIESQPVKPGHENLCYDKEENIFYKKGEEMKWKFKECGRKICQGSFGKNAVYAEIQTCGKVYVPPGCKEVINLDLPYPKCCQRVICPNMLSSLTT